MISLALWVLQGPFIHHATADYEKSVINGITVFVSPEAKSHPETTKPCLELISKATREFLRFTPKATHVTLKKTRIWVEQMNPAFPSMCFHESSQECRI
ncbi:MAG: hypothetical protein K8R88_07010 [Armatimonadetes bacterium]|nr:hypothetical protein [Armatimonadota bacterium]